MMRSSKKNTLILIAVVFLFLIISNFTFAQRPLEVDYPAIEGIRPQDTSITLPEYVKYIFNFSLGMAGLIIFIILIYAGFRRLTSAGNPSAEKDARDRISSAILGLVILLLSYLILTTINPELVFLSIPERVVFDPEHGVDREPKEESLAYTEIPVGSLIGELFESGRLASLKDLAEKTKKQSEKVKTLSEELDSLTDQCACANISPRCSGGCSSSVCLGDPCPVMDEINEKREELGAAISEEENNKGLEYWRKKLMMEVNGYIKEDGEKFIGFREVYEDLKSAENMVKECPFSASKNGKTQNLWGYSDFLEYRSYLKDFHDVKKDEPEYPFDYITLGHQYYLASFYCAEIFFQISPISISEEDLSSIETDTISVSETKETICGQEIPIGESVDNAEELARIMLIEFDNINNNIPKEIENVKKLIPLTNPDSCVEGDCTPEFDCYIEVTEVECDEGPIEPLPGDLPDGTESWPDYEELFLMIPTVLAETCTEEECISPSTCSCSNCPGELPLKPQITDKIDNIKEANLQIVSSYETVENLIKGKDIEDKFKISNIYANLSVAQNELSACLNPKETQNKLYEIKGKTISESLYSCTEFKRSLQWQIFYNEEYQPISECYGSYYENPDSFDNFFCCKEEFSPQ